MCFDEKEKRATTSWKHFVCRYFKRLSLKIEHKQKQSVFCWLSLQCFLLFSLTSAVPFAYFINMCRLPDNTNHNKMKHTDNGTDAKMCAEEREHLYIMDGIGGRLHTPHSRHMNNRKLQLLKADVLFVCRLEHPRYMYRSIRCEPTNHGP